MLQNQSGQNMMVDMETKRTFKVTPEAAARAVRLIAHHGGDLNAAAHDLRIGLQSLGNMTDRKSEAVLLVLQYLQRVPADKLTSTLATLRTIAAPALCADCEQLDETTMATTTWDDGETVRPLCADCWKRRDNAEPTDEADGR